MSTRTDYGAKWPEAVAKVTDDLDVLLAFYDFLTWDRGAEMARHDLLTELFAEGIYFAPPASPWLRGTNEATNGLLRQYFPNGGDPSVHGPDALSGLDLVL